MARHLFAEEEEARIEIIPMIDIMMFLLVFFIMVTLKMISNAGVTQDLPGDAVPLEQQKINKLIVGVAADGRLSLNGQPINDSGLQRALQQAHRDESASGKVNVLIAAEKQANLQEVMHVADAVRQADIRALGISTQSESASSEHGVLK